MYLLGIDLGTTGLKSSIIDINGTIIASGYKEYKINVLDNGFVEQSAIQWWDALCSSLKKCDSQVPGVLKKIDAISFSSQGSTFVPVGKNGKEISPAIIWLDHRAIEQLNLFKKVIGFKEIYKISGLRPYPGWTGLVIKWIKDNTPDLYNQTYKFLLASDYLVHLLTNKYVTDYTLASRTYIFDINTQQWSDEICSIVGIDIGKLPEAYLPGTKIGAVSNSAAHQTGLKEGIPVCVGAFDQTSGMVGSGGIQPSNTTISFGTATAINMNCTKNISDSGMRFLLGRFVTPDRWVLHTPIPTSCVLLRWFRDTFFQHISDKKNLYKEFDLWAETITPGSDGLMIFPHFSGSASPNWNFNARGVFWGLTLQHTQVHFIRAIMEGICFEIKNNLLLMEELAEESNEIRIVGGGAKSNFLGQLLANITQKRIIRPEITEAGSVGAAILAGCGTDIFDSMETAVNKMVKINKIFLPEQKNQQIYQELSSKYNQLNEQIVKLYPTD